MFLAFSCMGITPRVSLTGIPAFGGIKRPYETTKRNDVLQGRRPFQMARSIRDFPRASGCGVSGCGRQTWVVSVTRSLAGRVPPRWPINPGPTDPTGKSRLQIMSVRLSACKPQRGMTQMSETTPIPKVGGTPKRRLPPDLHGSSGCGKCPNGEPNNQVDQAVPGAFLIGLQLYWILVYFTRRFSGPNGPQ